MIAIPCFDRKEMERHCPLGVLQTVIPIVPRQHVGLHQCLINSFARKNESGATSVILVTPKLETKYI